LVRKPQASIAHPEPVSLEVCGVKVLLGMTLAEARQRFAAGGCHIVVRNMGTNGQKDTVEAGNVNAPPLDESASMSELVFVGDKVASASSIHVSGTALDLAYSLIAAMQNAEASTGGLFAACDVLNANSTDSHPGRSTSTTATVSKCGETLIEISVENVTDANLPNSPGIGVNFIVTIGQLHAEQLAGIK
jgi:hypothetical protein